MRLANYKRSMVHGDDSEHEASIALPAVHRISATTTPFRFCQAMHYNRIAGHKDGLAHDALVDEVQDTFVHPDGDV